MLAAAAADRPDLTSRLEDIFEEATSRGFVGTMPQQLQRHYVSERAWNEARALHARFGWHDLQVPEVYEPALPVSGPAVYEIAEDGTSMTLRPVDIVSRPVIVAVVSGGCHFSRDADEAIAANPDLSAALAEHTIYVDPSRYAVRLHALAENNRTKPYKVRVLYKEAGWRGLDFSRIARFYFLRDGRVVHDVVGMRPTIVEELRQGLAKLGLS